MGIGRPAIVGDGRKYSEQRRRRYSGPFPKTDGRNRRSTDPLPRFFPHTQNDGYQALATGQRQRPYLAPSFPRHVAKKCWTFLNQSRVPSLNMVTTQEKTTEVSTESNLSQAEIDTKKDIKPMEIEDARVVTEDEVQKYSKDDDEAMAAYARYHGPPLVLDKETNKRLLRTIDWHLMPIL